MSASAASRGKPARSGGGGGAGGGRRWPQDSEYLPEAPGGVGGWMAGGYLGHRVSLADGWRSNGWGIGVLRWARTPVRGKSGGSTTLLPTGAAPLRYARRWRTKKGAPRPLAAAPLCHVAMVQM